MALAETIAEEDVARSVSVLTRDFLGPIFGHDTRDRAVVVFGFDRFDAPEIFRPLDDVALWERPDAADDASRRIDAA